MTQYNSVPPPQSPPEFNFPNAQQPTSFSATPRSNTNPYNFPSFGQVSYNVARDQVLFGPTTNNSPANSNRPGLGFVPEGSTPNPTTNPTSKSEGGMAQAAAAAALGQAGGSVLSSAITGIVSAVNTQKQINFQKEAFGQQLDFAKDAFSKTYQLSTKQFEFGVKAYNREWDSAREAGLLNPAQFSQISGGFAAQRFSQAYNAVRTTRNSTFGV